MVGAAGVGWWGAGVGEVDPGGPLLGSWREGGRCGRKPGVRRHAEVDEAGLGHLVNVDAVLGLLRGLGRSVAVAVGRITQLVSRAFSWARLSSESSFLKMSPSPTNGDLGTLSFLRVSEWLGKSGRGPPGSGASRAGAAWTHWPAGCWGIGAPCVGPSWLLLLWRDDV